MACLMAGRLGCGGRPPILFFRPAASRRRDWRKAYAIMVIKARRLSPILDLPSKWSRPSSSLSC
jgi:hypothetical protein